jgi:hypothetical protein
MVGGVSRGAVGRRRKKKRNALDEVTEEVAAELEPKRSMGALEQVRLETETDPENVRRMRAEGQKLSTEQQKIAFEQGTERPFTGSHLDEKRPGTFVDPITGAITPRVASQASCMKRPRSRVIISPSSNDIAPAAASAVNSPRDKPAVASARKLGTRS